MPRDDFRSASRLRIRLAAARGIIAACAPGDEPAQMSDYQLGRIAAAVEPGEVEGVDHETLLAALHAVRREGQELHL